MVAPFDSMLWGDGDDGSGRTGTFSTHGDTTITEADQLCSRGNGCLGHHPADLTSGAVLRSSDGTYIFEQGATNIEVMLLVLRHLLHPHFESPLDCLYPAGSPGARCVHPHHLLGAVHLRFVQMVALLGG